MSMQLGTASVTATWTRYHLRLGAAPAVTAGARAGAPSRVIAHGLFRRRPKRLVGTVSPQPPPGARLTTGAPCSGTGSVRRGDSRAATPAWLGEHDGLPHRELAVHAGVECADERERAARAV